MFPTGQNNARGEEAYGVVQAGQSCGEDDLGIIGVTEEGEYLSCRLSEDGPAFG